MGLCAIAPSTSYSGGSTKNASSSFLDWMLCYAHTVSVLPYAMLPSCLVEALQS